MRSDTTTSIGSAAWARIGKCHSIRGRCSTAGWVARGAVAGTAVGRISMVIGTLVCMVLVDGQPAAATPLSIEYSGNQVRAVGATPHGAVAFHGAWWKSSGWFPVMVLSDQLLADENGDGLVVKELEEDVPFNSLWSVIDVATASFVVAPAGDHSWNEIPFPDDALVEGDGGIEYLKLPAWPDSPFDPYRTWSVSFVSQGRGAWHEYAGNGGASDADGTYDDFITLRLADMTVFPGGPPAPLALRDRDVIIGFDPRNTEYFSFRFQSAAPVPMLSGWALAALLASLAVAGALVLRGR